MANHASHAALPYPIKGARFTVGVPYLDADGDPTDPGTPDTEISEDGAAFTDTAEEVSTVSGTGTGSGYLTLSGAETDCSLVQLAFKVSTGPKATLMTLYPRVLGIVESGTAQAGANGSITLEATAAAFDLEGCFVKTTGGTGGGGTGGANNQARRITAYNPSTKVANIVPNWETNPSSDTTYDILLPEGATLGSLKALNPATAGRTLVVDAAGLADANTVKVGPSGSGTAQTAGDIIGDTNDIQSRLPAALTGDGNMKVDVLAISGDTAAADNLESYTDGTTPMPVNATQISGDSVAADNLEAAADGTGYNLGGGSIVAASVTGAVGSVTGNVGGNVVGSVGSVTGAVGSVTGNVGGNVVGSVGSLAAQAKADVNAEADTALADVGLTTTVTGRIDAAVTSRATPAQVNTEVLDVLNTDTFAEPGQGTPAATASLVTKIGFLYKAFRNRLTSSTSQISLYSDDGATVDQKAATSDAGGTYDRGEFESGP